MRGKLSRARSLSPGANWDAGGSALGRARAFALGGTGPLDRFLHRPSKTSGGEFDLACPLTGPKGASVLWSRRSTFRFWHNLSLQESSRDSVAGKLAAGKGARPGVSRQRQAPARLGMLESHLVTVRKARPACPPYIWRRREAALHRTKQATWGQAASPLSRNIRRCAGAGPATTRPAGSRCPLRSSGAGACAGRIRVFVGDGSYAREGSGCSPRRSAPTDRAGSAGG